MLQLIKTVITLIFCCLVIFISCKTKSQSSGKSTFTVIDNADSILNQFRNCFDDTLTLPKNYVNDYENIFTQEQEMYLNHLIDSFEKQTTNEIAVVSFDTAMVTRQNFDSLTLLLANTWGLGKGERNNGVLIGISAGYRKMRIQNGRGVEGILTDSATQIIIDSNFIPRFKEGDYFRGTVNGINSIIQKLNLLL